MAGLGQAAGWREFFVVLDVEVPEADRNHFAGFVGGDWAGLVASAGKSLALEADPSMDVTRGVLGPWTCLGRRVGHGHMG